MFTYMSDHVIVMTPVKDIRAIAREALRGKWAKAAAGTLMYALIVRLPSILLDSMFHSGIASSLYIFIMTGAFILGYTTFMLSIFRGGDASYSQLFSGIERLGKALLLYVYMCFFIYLWSMLFIIPGIFAAIRYSQSFYILADNPDMPIPDIVRESKDMMRINLSKYIYLMISFAGWAILAALPASFLGAIENNMIFSPGVGVIMSFIMAAGYFVLVPYIEAASIAMYEMINGNLRPGIINGKASVVDTPDPVYKDDDSEN